MTGCLLDFGFNTHVHVATLADPPVATDYKPAAEKRFK